MNVLVALLGVIATQLVTTLVGVIPALATLDTQAVEFLAHVSTSIYNKCLVFFFCLFPSVKCLLHLMMEVATKAVKTQNDM